MSSRYEPTVMRHPVNQPGGGNKRSTQSSEVGYVPNHDWPDDMVALLKAELLRGQSRSEIASTINGSGRWPKNRKSRCAVGAKIGRLDIGDTKGLPEKEPTDKERKAAIWTQPLDALIVKLYDDAKGLTTGQIAAQVLIECGVKLAHQAVRFRLTDLGVFKVKGELVKHRHRGGASLSNGWVSGGGGEATLVDIVEPNPPTSVHSHETEADQCQWPTSANARDMHVCGEKAVCGAYCERHGAIAYRKPPRAGRAGAFHKVDTDWQRGMIAQECH